jgi:DNA-binding HxlR family transcriptional regulator
MTLHESKASCTERCPIRDVLNRIGDRWSVLVVHELAGGTRRFSELKAGIEDISQRMLAQTLRRLEEDGFVSRFVHSTIPPRVDYTLTPLGRSLLKPLNALVRWADKHHGAVRAARRAYAAPASGGHGARA